MTKSNKAVNSKKAIETAVVNQAIAPVAQPEVKIEPVVTEEDANVGKPELVVVTTERKPLVVVQGNPGSKSKAVDDIPQDVIDQVKALNLNTCNSIKTLWANGYSCSQIIKAGYNSSTTFRQVGEYKKGLIAKAAKEAAELAALEVAAPAIEEPAI